LGHINYIYRHKVSKEKWKITDEFGHEVFVTGDHSIMVERNGALLEVKPSEINFETDFLITIKENV
jgi:intein/homing endonuclease